MDAAHEAWLKTLAKACDRVLASDTFDPPRDPYLRALHSDVEALRGRLAAELSEDDSSGSSLAPRQ